MARTILTPQSKNSSRAPARVCSVVLSFTLNQFLACVSVQLDKKVIEGIAVGDAAYCDKSLLKASFEYTRV